jgi:hypothetical protein
MVTPFGNDWLASELRDATELLKSAYWKMNSFRREPLTT